MPGEDVRDEPDRRSPLLSSRNQLKIASFSMNCRRGSTSTTAKGSIAELDWQQQVQIARASEDAGLEAIIPIARWRGYPGPSNFQRGTYETVPWAAGLAAVTSRIAVFSTVHIPLVHPVRAAKELATIDHISGGRFGLNIVCGWNTAEFGTFGHQQHSHDERYAQGAEWTQFLKALWRSKSEFDWNGTYYNARSANQDRSRSARSS